MQTLEERRKLESRITSRVSAIEMVEIIKTINPPREIMIIVIKNCESRMLRNFIEAQAK